ncbi:hypothetical protein [Metamycoplasma hominis]|nr:hypothetical protein [Metamycoplasma hominis]
MQVLWDKSCAFGNNEKICLTLPRGWGKLFKVEEWEQRKQVIL